MSERLSQHNSERAAVDSLFGGAGEMRARCRAFEWAATALGPVKMWPVELRCAVQLSLDSTVAMCVYAGPELILVYNDAFVEALGSAKHPWALGRTAREVWPEIWDDVGPEFTQVFAGGGAVHHADREFAIDRNGRRETTYWSYSFSAVRDENGRIVAAHNTATETTARVNAERGLRESEARRKYFVNSAEPGQEADARFRALVNASSDVLYRMNADWSEMRQLNSAGFLAETAEPSTSWFERYIPMEEQPQVREAIQKAIYTKSVFELEHPVRRADGSLGWTLSRAVPVMDQSGNIIEWFGAASDVTARRNAEEELRNALSQKETLLKEVHHRVKNNLQVIDSLLRLQSDAFPDSRLRSIVDETANRVHVIAEIHQLLYQSTDLANVDVAAFIERLSESLSAVHGGEQRPQMLIHADRLRLDLQRAVPLGLVFNELISNALKHGFPNGRRGTIRIDLHHDGDWIVAGVADDGIGFPHPLPTGSLGLQLVRVLTEQLKGEVRFDRTGGARVRLRFPAA